MTTSTARVADEPDDSQQGSGATVLPWPRDPQGTDPRAAWISEAEQHVRSTVRVPADHPARAWSADVATEVEAAGALVYKAAHAAATQAIGEARTASDPPKAERAEQWRKELGRIKRGPKYGALTPDRWLSLADAVRLALVWLPEAGLGDGPTLALARLSEVATQRQAAISEARAELVALAAADEIERRSAPGSWDDELGRRRQAGQGTRDARKADRARKASLVPSPDDPMAVARRLEPEWTRGGVLILRRWRGEWWRWSGSHWVQGPDEEMRAHLYRRMEHAEYLAVDGRSGIKSERKWAPTGAKISNLTEATAAVTLLPSSVEAPGWTDGRSSGGVVIPCRNGLVDLATRALTAPTPGYFNTSSVPFDYDPRAARPIQWLRFLDSLWPGDPGAISALQEVFGYILSGRRDLQKIILLVGPTRSGKGTIAKVLTALIGPDHTEGPTLSKFAEAFGLSDLIGKALAIIPDARMPREGAGSIVEKLLMISGGDRITISRKHRDSWTGQLQTQLVIMSNELPTLPDAAAAIAGRLFVLRMVKSFYNTEDTGLLAALMPELPGIFNWSLEGLDRLTSRGRFLEPDSSAEAAELLREKSSPIKEFLAECCILDPGAETPEDALWKAWESWHITSKREHIGTRSKLRTDLFSAAPEVKRGRPRADSPDGKRPWIYTGVRVV